MKNIILLSVAVMLLTSPLFGVIARVQTSGAGYNANNSTAVSATTSYASNTVAGNLLILFATSASGVLSGTPPTPTISTPTTSGGYSGTWVLAGCETTGTFYTYSSANYLEVACLYYIANAPSMLSSDIVTVTGHTLSTANIQVGFFLSEWSGAATSSPLDSTAGGQGTGGTPSAGTISGTVGDLFLAYETDVLFSFGVGLTPGSGWSSVPYGGTSSGLPEQILNASSSSYTANYTGTITPASNWAVIAASFKPASGGVTVVPRHRGFVN